MNETTNIHPDEVIEVTTAVCESLFGAIPSAHGEPSPAGDRITAWVSISGAWQGDVEVRVTPELASRLARLVLQVGPGPSDDRDIRDVLGEVANMIGGNLKALLPEPCALSLPRVVRSPHLLNPDLVQGFVLEGDAFEVAVAGNH